MEGRLHSSTNSSAPFALGHHSAQQCNSFVGQQRRLPPDSLTGAAQLSSSPSVSLSKQDYQGSYAVERLLQQQASNVIDAKPTISPALLSAVDLVSSSQEPLEALHRRQQEQLAIAQQHLAAASSPLFTPAGQLLGQRTEPSLISSFQSLLGAHQPQPFAAQQRRRQSNADDGPPLPQLNSLVKSIDRRLAGAGELTDQQFVTEEHPIGAVISPGSLSSSPTSCATSEQRCEAVDKEDRLSYQLRAVSPLRGRGRPSANPSLDGSPRQHTCPDCGKAFPNNSALVKHRLIHSDERNFICSICQKAFKRQDHLNGHLNVHKTVKPFPCIIGHCDKSYCDARSLRRHLEHSHNIQNPVVHSSKGTVYIKCDDLEATVLPNRGAEETSQAGAMAETSCGSTIPGQEYSDPDTYDDPDQCRQGKPVECAQCGRSFKNTPALNGHMRLHSHVPGRGENMQKGLDELACKPGDEGALSYFVSPGGPSGHSSTGPEPMHGSPRGAPMAPSASVPSSPTYQQRLDPAVHTEYNIQPDLELNRPGPGLLMYAPSQPLHSAYHVSDAQVQTMYDYTSPMSSRPPSHCSGQAAPTYLPEGRHQHQAGQGYADLLVGAGPGGAGGNVLSGTNDPTMMSPHLASLTGMEVSASPDLSFRLAAGPAASMVPMLGGCSAGDGQYCAAGRHDRVDATGQTLVHDFGFPGPYAGGASGDRAGVHESQRVASPLTDTGHLEGPLDLGPELSKDVDDELIQKELLSFMRFPGSTDGFNPFMNDDDDMLFSSPGKLTERKRHMTAPSALAGAGCYSSLAQVGHLYNYHQQQSSSSSLSGYGSPKPCPNMAIGAGPANPPVDPFLPSTSTSASVAPGGGPDNGRGASSGKKSRPASRQRRRSRGKPDNVFMLLKSVGLRRSFNLPVSPPGFRKQSAAVESGRKFSISGGGNRAGVKCHHRSGGSLRHGNRPKPAPLLIPRASLNRFHSQLRSPRLWATGCVEYAKSGYSTPTPYTPPPILSPVRHGSGLFWTISKALAAFAGPKSAPISPRFGRAFWSKTLVPSYSSECQAAATSAGSGVGEASDQACSGATRATTPLEEAGQQPPATDTTPHINIGPGYQAEIPELKSCDSCIDEYERADLLYNPSRCEHLDDAEMDAFCKVASSTATAGGGRNAEYALRLLNAVDGDLQRAYFLLISSTSSNSPYSGIPVDYDYVDTCLWSCQEIVNFQDAILKHDKDFYVIASVVETKSVKQCVQFYYTWKKTCTDEYKRLRAARRRRILPAVALEPNIYDLRSLGPVETIVPSAAVGSPFAGPVGEQRGSREATPSLPRSNTDAGLQRDCTEYGDANQETDALAQAYSYPSRLESPATDAGSTSDTVFPCRLCGKVFYKVKSRNAHMKSHRVVTVKKGSPAPAQFQ